MTVYEYCEFLAFEHPLSARERRELLELAPRAAVTATRFCTGYGTGRFAGDPHLLMARHFDAMVRLASTGERELMLKLPRESALEGERLRQYLRGDSASFDGIGDSLILDLCSETDDPDDWAEGEGWMAALAPVRAELLGGDCRPLYLGWLLSAGNGDLPDDAAEPPLPRGLRELSGPQLELADFLRLDDDLLAAAAAASPPEHLDPQPLRARVCELSAAEKDALLAEAAAGHPERAVARLRGRLGTIEPPPPERRTVGSLCEAAGQRRNDRERDEAWKRARRKAAQAGRLRTP